MVIVVIVMLEKHIFTTVISNYIPIILEYLYYCNQVIKMGEGKWVHFTFENFQEDDSPLAITLSFTEAGCMPLLYLVSNMITRRTIDLYIFDNCKSV